MPRHRELLRSMRADTGIPEVLLTSRELAARWGMNEGSVRMMRSEGRGPAYVTLGKPGRGRRPRVRYKLSVIHAYEQEHHGQIQQGKTARAQATRRAARATPFSPGRAPSAPRRRL